MEIGTIESLDEANDSSLTKDGKSRVSTPGGKSGGPNDGGNDGGGEDGGGKDNRNQSPNDLREPESHMEAEKSRILMWFLLLAVLMTFGGLIGAYVVLSTNAALEWRPFDLPPQVWISTALILLSSVSYGFGKRALLGLNFEKAKKWFLGTTVLGGMFISSQILTWFALVGRGLYMTGNPFAGFFYILTAVHAVHVIGGICALGYVLLKTWNAADTVFGRKKLFADAAAIGLYWHTMDALWLVLLFLLGFWK